METQFSEFSPFCSDTAHMNIERRLAELRHKMDNSTGTQSDLIESDQPDALLAAVDVMEASDGQCNEVPHLPLDQLEQVQDDGAGDYRELDDVRFGQHLKSDTFKSSMDSGLFTGDPSVASVSPREDDHTEQAQQQEALPDVAGNAMTDLSDGAVRADNTGSEAPVDDGVVPTRQTEVLRPNETSYPSAIQPLTVDTDLSQNVASDDKQTPPTVEDLAPSLPITDKEKLKVAKRSRKNKKKRKSHQPVSAAVTSSAADSAESAIPASVTPVEASSQGVVPAKTPSTLVVPVEAKPASADVAPEATTRADDRSADAVPVDSTSAEFVPPMNTPSVDSVLADDLSAEKVPTENTHPQAVPTHTASADATLEDTIAADDTSVDAIPTDRLTIVDNAASNRNYVDRSTSTDPVTCRAAETQAVCEVRSVSSVTETLPCNTQETQSDDQIPPNTDPTVNISLPWDKKTSDSGSQTDPANEEPIVSESHAGVADPLDIIGECNFSVLLVADVTITADVSHCKHYSHCRRYSSDTIIQVRVQQLTMTQWMKLMPLLLLPKHSGMFRICQHFGRGSPLPGESQSYQQMWLNCPAPMPQTGTPVAIFQPFNLPSIISSSVSIISN